MFNPTLKSSLFLIILFFFSCSSKPNEKEKEVVSNSPWEQAAVIIAEVEKIDFPDSIFTITQFGALSDGITLNTEAITKAIKTCSSAGGGKVVVPAGKFLTGAIHLEDNVNLYLEKGAELIFSTNTEDYPLVNTSFEGTELINFSPLIYAYKKKNIGISGHGILNGQANNENWWPWTGSSRYGWKEGHPNQNDSLNRPTLVQMAEDGIPVENRIFGEGHYIRPNFIEPHDCENVLIQGVTIIDAPFWVIHPFKSKNILIDGVKVESHGPNNDGCDPEYSKNVVIRNCLFNTGDDCIAIKSGRNADGRRVNIPSENIVVQKCKMIDGHGGVVMGSEISAGVRNVFVEDCHMDSPNLDRAIRIKTNTKRGGFVEKVYVRNIEVGQVKEAVLKVNLHYGVYGNQTGNFLPTVSDIFLENISVKNGGKYGVLVDGLEKSAVKNIILKNVSIDKVEEPHSLKYVENIEFNNTSVNGEFIK